MDERENRTLQGAGKGARRPKDRSAAQSIPFIIRPKPSVKSKTPAPNSSGLSPSSETSQRSELSPDSLSPTSNSGASDSQAPAPNPAPQHPQGREEERRGNGRADGEARPHAQGQKKPSALERGETEQSKGEFEQRVYKGKDFESIKTELPPPQAPLPPGAGLDAEAFSEAAIAPNTVGHRQGRLIERRVRLPLDYSAVLWPGLVAGLAAGVLLIFTSMLAGQEPTRHLRGVSWLVMGNSALLPDAAPVWLGFLLMAVVGALLASLYLMVVRLSTRGRAVGLGLLYGLGLWLFSYQLLLPLLAPGFAAQIPAWAWMAAMFLYGAVLGILIPTIPRPTSRQVVPGTAGHRAT